ncbi:hypothetical protein ACWEU6_28140 [Streptosporangium sandarakinum]|uniref:hypothetical protein n=1 Tax=Streptosporangium sandarakinum TaxID=1260955 RepID=UPI00367F10B8
MLLLATACTGGGPSLDEAAQVLAADAKKLESLHPAVDKKVVDETGDGNDDFASCSNDDTALRVYQVTGNLEEGTQPIPAEQADLYGRPLRDRLKEIGYTIDRNSSWAQPGRSVLILRKQDPGITFIVLVQTSQPNVEIIGKTDCLPAPRRSERGSG